MIIQRYPEAEGLDGLQQLMGYSPLSGALETEM